MNIFNPLVTGSLSVSGSGEISGDLTVLGTLYATISGTSQNAISASHAAAYTLTSSFNQFTAAYNTGSFTGSFIGDGAGLFNIPASGVTGLNLSQISDGAATASISAADGFKVNTNSQFTGSVNITGSIFLNGQPIGTGKLDETVFNEYSASNNLTNSLQNNRLGTLENATSSLNSYTSSNNQVITSLQTSTGSLNSFTASANTKFSSIEGTTGSLNSFTSSINTTIKNRLNTENVISGSVQVVLSDVTGYSTFSSSLATTDAGQDNRLSSLESATSSINSYTSSNNSTNTTQNNRLSALETTTGSLNTFTSSTANRLIELENASASIRSNFNTYTSSNDSTNTVQNNRLAALETSTGSLNTFTSSTNTRLDLIETSTGSLNSFSSSTNTRLGLIETSTGSLNTFTSSATSRLSSLETASGSIRTDFNSYTSSNNSTNTTQNSRLTSLETSTGSLNSFSSSTNTKLGLIETSTASLNTFTSSTNTRLGLIETSTGSLNAYTTSNNLNISAIHTATSSLNSYTASNDSTNTTQNSRLTSLETASGSIRTDFNSYTSSNNSTNTTQNNRLSSLESTTSSLNSFTSSTNTRLNSIETSTGSLNTFTSSINTTIKNRLNAENVISGSVQVTLSNTTGYSTFSSSLATTDAGQDSRLTSLEGKTGSYATTGSNVFIGNQTITGSLFISQDLIIGGSSSIQHISSSVVNIADNIITVNAQNPSVRFGGLAVVDSGSSPQVSGSMLFDSVNNQWLFVHQNQGTITSSVLLMGPETYNNLGNETYITANRLVKSTGIEHLADSNITDTGTKVSINSNTEITGSLITTGNVTSNTNLVSNFSSGDEGGEISLNKPVTNTTINSGITIDVWRDRVRIFESGGTNRGGFFNIANLSAGVGTNFQANADTASFVEYANVANKPTLVSGSSQITYSGISGIPSGIVSGSSQVSFNGITDRPTLVSGSSQISFNGITDRPTLVSGSSQINHDTTTNYVANQHIDHTSVSITAGSGLSGGGTIASTRTITLDTGSVHFLDGVKKELNTEGVVSGSSQVAHNSTTGYVANEHINHANVTITAGDGLTGGGDITTSRTINVASANNGIVVNADNIQLDTSSTTFSNGVKSKMNTDGVISGSAQIIASLPAGTVSGSLQVAHNSTTGYVANEHINHTSVSISAGSGLSGGGDISTTRTLTLDTGSLHFTNGVKAKMNADGVVSGSAQLTSTFVQKAGDTMTGDLIIRNTGTFNNLRLYANDDNTWIEQTKPDSTIVGRIGFDGYSTSNAYYTDFTLSTRGSSDSALTTRMSISIGNVLAFQNLAGFTYNGNTVYHSGNLTNLNQLTNGPGYITSYTETDTLATVTARGSSTSTALTLSGRVTFASAIANRPQMPGGIIGLDTGDGNFDIWGISREFYPSHPTAANAWGILWDGDSNQVRFIGAGSQRLVVDLDGGSTGALRWEGNDIWHAGNLTNLNQLTNGPGYITSASVGNGTLTLAVSGTGLSGSASFTANQSGNATFTVTSNATSANTASTIVARDSSGNFSAGTITASLSGNATTATTLQTARTIGGVSFNGSANIDLPGVNTTGNQNTTGTASNITAFTINQNVGSGNTPTFAGLTVGAGIATGRSAWGSFTNANIILTSSTSDSTGNCGIEFRSGNNFPSDGAAIFFENNGGGGSERAKLTIRVENDQEDFIELRGGNITLNANTISGGGQNPSIIFQNGGTTVSSISSTGVYNGSISGNAATSSRVVNGTSTLAGVTFGNTMLATQTATRVVNFDGNGGAPSVWWTNGSTAIGAIDAISGGGLSFWSNNGSSWQQQVSMTHGTFNVLTNLQQGGTQVVTNNGGTWGINVTGNAGSVTNGVYTTGNQTIGGEKTFSSRAIFNGNVLVSPVPSSWAEGLAFTMPSTSTWGGLRWRRERAGNDGNWYVGFTALDSSDDLVFGANNGGSQVDNILRMRKNGNVIFGSSASSTAKVSIYSTVVNSTVFDVQGVSGQLFSVTDDLTGQLFAVSDISGIPILDVNSNGVVTIDDTLNVFGDVTAYFSSDERLKDNVTPITNSIEKMKQIGGYEFDWNSLSQHTGHDVGVIAQEIEKVLPELVTTRSNGFKAVKYEKLTALLIEANKELIKRVEELEKKIK